MLLHFDNLLKDRIGGQFTLYVHPHFTDFEDKRVLVIDVKPAGSPAFMKDGDNQRFYRARWCIDRRARRPPDAGVHRAAVQVGDTVARGIFEELFSYRPRDGFHSRPENFLTQALAHVLRNDRAACDAFLSLVLGQTVTLPGSYTVDTQLSRGDEEDGGIPDMQIRATLEDEHQLHLVCEHKWDAPVSAEQLGRYVRALPKAPQIAQVVLIANTRELPTGVPSAGARFSALTWSDVHARLSQVHPGDRAFSPTFSSSWRHKGWTRARHLDSAAGRLHVRRSGPGSLRDRGIPADRNGTGLVHSEGLPGGTCCSKATVGSARNPVQREVGQGLARSWAVPRVPCGSGGPWRRRNACGSGIRCDARD